jgi:hypothetical protein
MSKKIEPSAPVTWIDELEDRSTEELIDLIIDQHVQILSLERQVQHLQTQTRANAVGEHRDEYINVLLQLDPWDGKVPSDAEIAKKAGTTVRVVREIRNKGGDKKPRGRPKKAS